MNIQEAIRSGKPFRRKGWVDDDIFVMYEDHDTVLTLETDSHMPVELDVQDILADDWYTRDKPDENQPKNEGRPKGLIVPIVRHVSIHSLGRDNGKYVTLQFSSRFSGIRP